MRQRRLPLGLFVPAALAVLVGLLATLQYRWLGQVSEAEREQMKRTLTQRAEEFAEAFDREVLHVFLTFQTESTALARRDWESFARRYDLWREHAEHPKLVRALYFAETSQSASSLMRYRSDGRRFEPTEWPPALTPVRDRIVRALEHAPTGTQGDHARAMITLHDPIVPSVPALLISLPLFESVALPETKALFSVRLNSGFLVAELDREYIEASLLPALAAEHFPARDTDDYRLAVIDAAPRLGSGRADPSKAIFSRGVPDGVVLDPARADATVPLFSLRTELSNQVVARSLMVGRMPVAAGEVVGAPPPPPPPPAGPISGTGAVQIFVEKRGGGAMDYRVTTRGVGSPGWQLVLQHPSGSLDTAVARARRRNLWLSFGILAVLVSGVGLVVVNARRSERLAAQQMDFVATVSHELRTPLAVIRSAAQNLSAGVVHDASQARRYGDLIESEGRRLTDMVEQVLAYAGLGDARALSSARPTNMAEVVGEVVAASNPLVRSAGFETTLNITDDLPLVLADEGAIRRALDNLLTNALKHGAEGRWLAVAVRRASAPGNRTKEEVQITVSDRGRGIDAADLPHIFEPFYRGRVALERQIHGNGLGLSLVNRIAQAHGGRVTVRSAPGEGTTFTLHLPTLSDVEGPALSDVEGPAAHQEAVNDHQDARPVKDITLRSSS